VCPQEHIAGVTFLAFANASPDLFSVFSAINDGPETASMAFGAAFGATLFVCTIVLGSIMLVQPFQFKRRPFLRDVILILIAVLGVSPPFSSRRHLDPHRRAWGKSSFIF
jgi:sodium/potassium/calcium exchanger 6